MSDLADPSRPLAYRVAMSAPATHLFEVSLEVPAGPARWVDLKFPVWTPGSYLVREYARHLQDFRAEALGSVGESHPGAQELLPWRKQAKHHWQVAAPEGKAWRVSYRLFANELTVRTNHLDASHAYFNGAATFLYVEAARSRPIHLTLVLPHPDWHCSSALPLLSPPPLGQTAQEITLVAADFDELVDSPVELGTHAVYEFSAAGKPHQLAIFGQGNAQAKDLIPEIQKIIATEAELFGGLPYDRYLFLLHLTNGGYGGLEHKNCCSLIYSRFGFLQKDKRDRFLQLVAHEFFHLWNVKRLLPQAFETFDYEKENYTSSLWFCEGLTSYYDLLIPLRAKVYNRATFLSSLAQEITRYFLTPGRQVQPLAESSFDAWIKLYRSEAHSNNHQISYYLKGEMVALILDLTLRQRHDNQRSLDDVLRLLWQRFGQQHRGYSEADLAQAINEVAETDLGGFLQSALYSTEELPIATALAPFGLQLRDNAAAQPPYLGLRVQGTGEREAVKFVEAGSPAHAAGLDPGDELLAIDGLRLQPGHLGDRLGDYAVGDRLTLSYFHQDELRHADLTLAPPQPTRYDLVAIAEVSPEQERRLAGWLGDP